MAEIINFNKARKAIAKADAKRDAKSNRAEHGRSNTDKGVAKARRERREHLLDGAKIEDASPSDNAQDSGLDDPKV